jgi:hypothetical protein
MCECRAPPMLSLPIRMNEGALRSIYAIIDPILIDPAILTCATKGGNNNENKYLLDSSIVTGILLHNNS